MLDGKPTIVLSYSTAFEGRVARPVAAELEPHGFKVVLVGDEPLPPGGESNPNAKVTWYFRHSDMAVFLATPDDRLESGEVHTRPNIIDEHRLGLELPHLRERLLVFKASEVTLPSNINPVYEQLPLDDTPWIVAKIVEQARAWGVLSDTQQPAPEPSPQSSEETTDHADPAGDDDAEATAQAVSSLEQAIEALQGTSMDRNELQRAELAIAALIGQSGSSDTLGVHLANRIFARRRELRLRHDERLALLRTYLRHTSDDNVPGLVWLKDLSRKAIVSLLTAITREDGDDTVRGRALRILGKLGEPSPPREAEELLLPFLTSDEQTLRWAAMDHIGARREPRLRHLLDDPHLLEHDRFHASRSAALLDARRHPGRVLARYIEDASVRDASVERVLLAASTRISRATVERAVRSPVKKVRELGLRMAAEKGSLSLATGTELLATEKSRSTRLQIVRVLLASGEPVDFALLDLASEKRDDDGAELGGFYEKHALEVEIGLRVPVEDLEQGIYWLSIRAPSLYEAMGLRDAEWAERHVRRDLTDDFARVKEARAPAMVAELTEETETHFGRPLSPAERAMVERGVTDALAKHFSGEDRIGAFVLGQFRVAALRVLAQHAKRTDIRFARRFADDEDPTILAAVLPLFERFGTAHDAPTVRSIVGRVHREEDVRRAAEIAFRLAYKKDKLDVLAELREHHYVRVWATERLADVPGGFDVAWQLLRSDDPDVRLAAAEVMWNAVKPEYADELLSHYMRHRHFYNVVRAIDQRLYAPNWLKAALTA